MSKEFDVYKLGDVSKIFAGGDKPQEFSDIQTEEYNVPIYANGETNLGLQGFAKIAKVNVPAVTVSARGTIGFAVLRMKPFVPIVRLLTLIPNVEKLDLLYLYHYLKLYRQSGIGSSQAQLIAPEIANRTIRLPNLSIQKSIGKVLSILDSKIDLNNRINAELEVMAKTLYDYWFVQFDFPDENGKPYKSSGGKLVWIEELKREIPEGWELKRLGDILRTQLGGTPSTKEKEFWDGEYPWLNSGEIVKFPIIDSELKITESGIKNSATSLMPKGTCVLSITRHLRPSILGIDSCANQSVVGLFESEKIKNSFIYPYLVNDIPRLMTLRSGAQQPHINKGTVDDSNIIIPTEKILNKYYSIVDSFYDNILNNAFQNQKLTELRDWLLPMLMNGQVKVN
jgi:type I restriction enzyme S subunit